MDRDAMEKYTGKAEALSVGIVGAEKRRTWEALGGWGGFLRGVHHILCPMKLQNLSTESRST